MERAELIKDEMVAGDGMDVNLMEFDEAKTNVNDLESEYV